MDGLSMEACTHSVATFSGLVRADGETLKKSSGTKQTVVI